MRAGVWMRRLFTSLPPQPSQLILTSERLHVLDSHPEDCQFIQLAGHGIAGGHQWRQLIDEAVHLVSATFLNLAMSLSVQEKTSDIKQVSMKKVIFHPSCWQKSTVNNNKPAWLNFTCSTKYKLLNLITTGKHDQAPYPTDSTVYAFIVLSNMI